MQRYDTYTFEATKTDEGFIVDKPIIGRVGLLKYLNADGTQRVEYRPPDEAFNEQSLASIRGKPITLGHKAMVNASNAKDIPIIGTVLSEGVKDGSNIRADVSIYSLPTDARELSCGYSLMLDETPGTTPNGEKYDAIQRNIRYNHLAVVPKGRAGVARLNMDGNQDNNIDGGKKDMVKIRLDNGIEYECSEEVKVEFEKMRADRAEQAKKYDTLKGNFDASEANAKKYKEEAERIKQDFSAKFDSAVSDRVAMLGMAKQFNIDSADTLSNKDIKVAIIKAVNGVNFDCDNKSDEYINGVFDFCKNNAKRNDEGNAQRREVMMQNKQNNNDSVEDWDYIAMANKMREDEQMAWMGGK